MSTILNRLEQHARSRPNHPFCHLFRHGRMDSLTYGGLAQRVGQFAGALRNAGVEAGEVVPLMLETGIDGYAGFLAVMALGAIPTFLPFPSVKQAPDRFWTEHERVFARLDVRTVVTEAALLPTVAHPLARAGHRILLLEELAADGQSSPPAWELGKGVGGGSDGDAVALLQHSSGTTGTKKGVALSHRAILDQADRYALSLGFGAEDRVATWLPLYHDMGLIATFLMPLVQGATICAMSPFEWVARPSLLLDVIDRHRCTIVWLPNFAFHLTARTTPADRFWDLSCVRAFVNCSEPCTPEAFEAFLGRLAGCGIEEDRLQVCYAMAENVFAATQTPPGAAARVFTLPDGSRRGSCGPPVPGVEIEVRDEDNRPCPDGEAGEILLRSPFLFSGYHRQPDLTEQRLRDGWYRTGDVGFLCDGELCVTGRRDDRFTVYGRNFHAFDVEALVGGVGGVLPGRCVALPLYNPSLGSNEVAVLVETSGKRPFAELRKDVKEVVQAGLGLMLGSVTEVPSGWVVKTTSGKVSRVENMRKYQDMMKARRNP